MKFRMQEHEGDLHLLLEGRLDSLQLEGENWQELSASIEAWSAGGAKQTVFVDFRFISYADSRSVHHLLDAISPARIAGNIVFIGPGPGIVQLLELGEAPFLSPMLKFAPWEEEEANSFAEHDGNSSENPDSLQRPGNSPVPNSSSISTLEQEIRGWLGEDEEKQSEQQELSEAVTEFEGSSFAAKLAAAERGQAGDSDVDEYAAWLKSQELQSQNQGVAAGEGEAENESQPEFEIDLQMEKIYLDNPSDSRDFLEAPETLTFAEAWQGLEPSGADDIAEGHDSPAQVSPTSPSNSASHAVPSLTDPVTLLLRGGVTQSSQVPLVEGAPSEDLPAKGPIAAEAVDHVRCSQPEDKEDFRTRLERKAAKLVGEVEEKEEADPTFNISPLQGGEAVGLADSDELRGVGLLLSELGRLQKLRIELQQDLVDLKEKEEQKELQFREQVEKNRDIEQQLIEAKDDLVREQKSYQEQLRAQERRFFDGQRPLSKYEVDALKTHWLALLGTFHSRGIAEQHQVDTFVERLAAVAEPLVLDLTALLDGTEIRFGQSRWRALVLALSTAVHEGMPEDRLRIAIRNWTLSALLECAPGRALAEGQTEDRIVAQVYDLLNRGAYLLAGEQAESPKLMTADMHLWAGSLKINTDSQPTGTRWKLALQQALHGTASGDSVRIGIARIVEIHSLYLPGSWLELVTGEIGIVLGSVPGRPEQPHMLLQFKRDGERSMPMPVREFPSHDQEIPAVLRVLDHPRLSEEICRHTIDETSPSAELRPGVDGPVKEHL